jgi:hypothetical protein
MSKNLVRVLEGAMTLPYGYLPYLHDRLRRRAGIGRDIYNRASLDLLCSADLVDRIFTAGLRVDSSNALLGG